MKRCAVVGALAAAAAGTPAVAAGADTTPASVTDVVMGRLAAGAPFVKFTLSEKVVMTPVLTRVAGRLSTTRVLRPRSVPAGRRSVELGALGAGPYRLALRMRDRAGNTSVEVVRFVVP